MSYEVVDGHLHIWNLSEIRDKLPADNASSSFPNDVDSAAINRTLDLAEIAPICERNGVRNAVFVQCFNDAPEEAEWVHRVSQDTPLIKGIVAGLDLEQHEKLRKNLDAMTKWKVPKLVGVRHITHFVPNDYFTRYAKRKTGCRMKFY